MHSSNENQKKATAADVAAAAGVSPSTVSRVLNDVETSFISEKTIEIVRNVAAELNYSPNPIARALRLQRTNLLGLIVREIADPFFAEFIDVLSIQARSLGYQVILGHAQSDPREGLVMNEVLDTRHCDGVLVLGDLRDDEPALQKMLQGNPAVVALCRGGAPSNVATVNADNRTGTYLLLDYLYEMGHRRFAFVDGGWLGDIRERRDAFLDYASDRNLELSAEAIQRGTNDANGGYVVMQRLLSLSPPPTAVLASDDVMAIGAMKAAIDAGLDVPNDISVAGFDDISIGRFVSPALTTVRQPIEEMCDRALQQMLDLIDGKTIPDDRVLIQLSPELIIRQSSGPVPTNSHDR